MQLLPIKYFESTQVLQIAEELLGTIIVTHINNEVTSGIIVETEAYAGVTDKASHAYKGRRTPRNETMYARGGTVYVYICYGIHDMLNIVTNKENTPDAILIRAIEPIEGMEIMQQRTGKFFTDTTITRGPGNVAKALGISKLQDGINLQNGAIKIYRNNTVQHFASLTGKGNRIGMETAGEAAKLPYRFFVKDNKYVSRPNK